MEKQTNKFLNKLPIVGKLYRFYLSGMEFKNNSCYPAGNYYSPIVSVEDIKKRESEIWSKANKDSISGINLRTEEQIILLESLSKYYNEIPFKPGKQPDIRYYYENDFYNYTDGIVLYSMLRHLRPKRVIEVGSGFSSAVILDTNELFLDNKINLTFIEPYPDRLYSLLKNTDKHSTTIIENNVQLVPLDTFKKLEAGDILFIDSSHISKTDSDLNHIIFEILPLLQSGVFIHFHDIFHPFEYPKEWVYEGRNWNENYLLRALLMYNDNFEIKLFSDYIHLHHKTAFKDMPLSYKNTGGNL